MVIIPWRGERSNLTPGQTMTLGTTLLTQMAAVARDRLTPRDVSLC